MMIEHPHEAIIISISKKMLKEKGYKNWLSNFLEAMSSDDWLYYFRTSNKPQDTSNLLYVYLSIGNRIRYRCNLVQVDGPGEKTFHSDAGSHTIYGRAWLICAGPAVRAPERIEWKGRQGFRYSKKLF